ncbi:MAG: sugar phosphate isomerase/epimerase [Phycisphaerae bacterium]|nr:sugar phosphate isomerase/epimerase [Phycisphaerae bacterium]
MKLSVTTLGWPGSPLDQVLGDIETAGGFAGIDFRGLGQDLDITKLPAFTLDLDKTMAKVKAAGLVVSGLSSSVRLVLNDKGTRNEEEAVSYCQLADRMGVPVIRIFGGQPRTGQSRDQWMAEAVDNLKRDVDRTSKCKAVICLETHDAWCHTPDVVELLDKVNSPRAMALWDIMITSCSGGENVATSAATLGKRIRYTHVKDGKVEGNDTHVLTLPGQGQVDLLGAVRELKNLGYNGWLTFEWEKRWHADLPDASVALPVYRDLFKSVI